MRAASAPGFVPARRDTEWGGRGMGSCREFRGARARQESARIRAWDRGWVGARGRGALASTPRADPTAIISLISWVAPLGRRCSPSASLARGMAHDSRARAFARGVCAPLSRAQTSKPLGSWVVLWTRDGWADGSRAPARPPRRPGCFDSTASLCTTAPIQHPLRTRACSRTPSRSPPVLSTPRSRASAYSPTAAAAAAAAT